MVFGFRLTTTTSLQNAIDLRRRSHPGRPRQASTLPVGARQADAEAKGGYRRREFWILMPVMMMQQMRVMVLVTISGQLFSTKP